MQMHDVVAVRDLGEIERLVLAAQADEAFLLPQCAQGLVPPENLGVAQDDQLAHRPDEAAQQRTHQERDPIDRDLRVAENFVQPLLLALVVAKDRDFPLLGEPVAQVIEKKIAPIFLEDEIAARRMEKVVREELLRRAAIWVAVFAGYLFFVLALFLLRAQAHLDKALRQVIAQRRRIGPAAQGRPRQADLRVLERLHRALRIYIEFAQ